MVDDILKKTNIPPNDNELQYRKDWKEFKQKTEELNSNVQKTVKRLRKIADRLDEAWWEYKMQYAVASSACIIGGIIRQRTGSVIALGFVIAGAVLSVRASSIKDAKDFEDNKVAGKLLEGTNDFFIREWSVKRENAQMINICQHVKLANWQDFTILREFIIAMGDPMAKEVETFLKKAKLVTKATFQTGAKGAAKAGAQVADDAVQAGAKISIQEVANNGAQFADDVAEAGCKTVENSLNRFIASLNTVFLVLDAIDLSFTIMDLVQNGGSDAAKDLRKIASEIEDNFLQ